MSGRTVSGATAITGISYQPIASAAPGGSVRSRAWPHATVRRDGFELFVPALECPPPPVHHPVVRPAEQRQVRQRRRPTLDPPDQVMPVTPAPPPVAAFEH